MKLSPVQLALSQSLQSMASKTAMAANAPQAGQAAFGDVLKEMIKKTSNSQEVASNLSERLQLDDPNVSIEQTVLASNEAQLNFQFVLQTRNKLTEAYQSLINMPV